MINLLICLNICFTFISIILLVMLLATLKKLRAARREIYWNEITIKSLEGDLARERNRWVETCQAVGSIVEETSRIRAGVS